MSQDWLDESQFIPDVVYENDRESDEDYEIGASQIPASRRKPKKQTEKHKKRVSITASDVKSTPSRAVASRKGNGPGNSNTLGFLTPAADATVHNVLEQELNHSDATTPKVGNQIITPAKTPGLLTLRKSDTPASKSKSPVSAHRPDSTRLFSNKATRTITEFFSSQQTKPGKSLDPVSQRKTKSSKSLSRINSTTDKVGNFYGLEIHHSLKEPLFARMTTKDPNTDLGKFDAASESGSESESLVLPLSENISFSKIAIGTPNKPIMTEVPSSSPQFSPLRTKDPEILGRLKALEDEMEGESGTRDRYKNLFSIVAAPRSALNVANSVISFQSLASIDCLDPKPAKGFDSEAHDFECELDQILDAGQEHKNGSGKFVGDEDNASDYHTSKEGSLDLVMSDTDKQSTNSPGTTNHIPSTHESSFTKTTKRKLSLITDEPFVALPKRTKNGRRLRRGIVGTSNKDLTLAGKASTQELANDNAIPTKDLVTMESSVPVAKSATVVTKPNDGSEVGRPIAKATPNTSFQEPSVLVPAIPSNTIIPATPRNQQLALSSGMNFTDLTFSSRIHSERDVSPIPCTKSIDRNRQNVSTEARNLSNVSTGARNLSHASTTTNDGVEFEQQRKRSSKTLRRIANRGNASTIDISGSANTTTTLTSENQSINIPPSKTQQRTHKVGDSLDVSAVESNQGSKVFIKQEDDSEIIIKREESEDSNHTTTKSRRVDTSAARNLKTRRLTAQNSRLSSIDESQGSEKIKKEPELDSFYEKFVRSDTFDTTNPQNPQPNFDEIIDQDEEMFGMGVRKHHLRRIGVFGDRFEGNEEESESSETQDNADESGFQCGQKTLKESITEQIRGNDLKNSKATKSIKGKTRGSHYDTLSKSKKNRLVNKKPSPELLLASDRYNNSLDNSLETESEHRLSADSLSTRKTSQEGEGNTERAASSNGVNEQDLGFIEADEQLLIESTASGEDFFIPSTQPAAVEQTMQYSFIKPSKPSISSSFDKYAGIIPKRSSGKKEASMINSKASFEESTKSGATTSILIPGTQNQDSTGINSNNNSIVGLDKDGDRLLLLYDSDMFENGDNNHVELLIDPSQTQTQTSQVMMHEDNRQNDLPTQSPFLGLLNLTGDGGDANANLDNNRDTGDHLGKNKSRVRRAVDLFEPCDMGNALTGEDRKGKESGGIVKESNRRSADDDDDDGLLYNTNTFGTETMSKVHNTQYYMKEMLTDTMMESIPFPDDS